MSYQNSFSLMIDPSKIRSKHRRRQSPSFVNYKGRSTTYCGDASTYYLYQGQLFIKYSNGTAAQFSTTTGLPYSLFAPSTTPGDILTTFSLSTTGSLLWTNPNFFNGGALFCLLPSGDLVAVFVQAAQPENCVYIDLTVATCKCLLSNLRSALLLDAYVRI